MINKLKCENIINNDVYFIKANRGKIIINDNYKGLIIYDFNMKYEKKINLFDDISLYSAYYHGNRLVLFCPENDCLICINVETGISNTIYLEEKQETIFRNEYIWRKEGLILISYTGEFYFLNLNEYKMRRLDIKNENINNFTYFSRLITNDIDGIIGMNCEFTYNYKDNNLEILNTKLSQSHSLKNMDFIDIKGQDEIFVILQEEGVIINKQGEKNIIKPEKEYTFRGIDIFLYNDNNYIVTLETSSLNYEVNKIAIYSI